MHKLSRRFPPDKQVLSDISLSFFPGAKIGVLGYNGAGKSTLLKIMAGLDTEFTGDAALGVNATVGMLSQEPELDPTKDVKGNVEDGVSEIRALLDRFNDLSMNYTDETADEFGRVQEQIDAVDGWNLDTTLEYAMDALRCPPGDADHRHALRRRAPSRGAVPAAAASARPAVARRADQPPRCRVGRMAGAAPAGLRAARWSRSPTIATSWTTSPAGSWSSTAATASPTRATIRAGLSRSRSVCSRRSARSPIASGRSPRSSSGSVPAPRLGAPSPAPG